MKFPDCQYIRDVMACNFTLKQMVVWNCGILTCIVLTQCYIYSHSRHTLDYRSPRHSPRLGANSRGVLEVNSLDVHNDEIAKVKLGLAAYNDGWDKKDPCKRGRWIEGKLPIYVITPTYPRAEQIPELTRMSQTLMNVDNIFWIVAEDSSEATVEVVQYLQTCPLRNVYIRTQMPHKYKSPKFVKKPRGVANRVAGLNWIRKNVKEGVIYFADDDNSYDLRIFDEIRSTKGVSMFPVGLVTKLGVSTPIVKDGKVIGFYDGWIAGRKFPVDMAGFAVNVDLFLKHPNATMPFIPGYEEDGFLQKLNFKMEDIEPKAENCSKIWVWHTQTKKNDGAKPGPPDINIVDTNLVSIQAQLWKGKLEDASVNGSNKKVNKLKS